MGQNRARLVFHVDHHRITTRSLIHRITELTLKRYYIASGHHRLNGFNWPSEYVTRQSISLNRVRLRPASAPRLTCFARGSFSACVPERRSGSSMGCLANMGSIMQIRRRIAASNVPGKISFEDYRTTGDLFLSRIVPACSPMLLNDSCFCSGQKLFCCQNGFPRLTHNGPARLYNGIGDAP